MTAKDDRKNAEGYNDPTAYNAIKNVEQEQDKDDMRFHLAGLSSRNQRTLQYQILASRSQ